MRVAELEGALLDYWVGKATGHDSLRTSDRRTQALDRSQGFGGGVWVDYSPSTNWTQGGPLIEGALISVLYGPVDSQGELGYWSAFVRSSDDESIDGPTYLVAAMRAYVASKFGKTVGEIPPADRAPLGMMS
jgi:hypothetical protein